jgi:hypothetical protein
VGDYNVTLTVSNGTAQNQTVRVISAVDASLLPVNLSKGKTATASTGAANAGKAVDDSMNTSWDATGGNWLTVDLGLVQSFNRIIIDWNVGCGYPSSYQVKVSSDNSSWTTIATLGKNPWPTHDMPDTINSSQSARYVQVNLVSTINGACGASLKEVQVFRVPQGPFSSGITVTGRHIQIEPPHSMAGMTIAGGRCLLSFGTSAQRTIALFLSSGRVLASTAITGENASISLPDRSVVLVRITEKGKSPVTRRIVGQ